MERPQYSETDMRQGTLFWECKNYEEYAIACDLEGQAPMLDRDEFECLKGWHHALASL